MRLGCLSWRQRVGSQNNAVTITQYLQGVFEREISEAARKELSPNYTCDERGRGIVHLTVKGQLFEIELDINYYKSNTNTLYALVGDGTKRYIGTVYFGDSGQTEARLLTTLKSYLDDPKAHIA